MFDLGRRRADCFWDYDFSDDELLNIAKNGSASEKKFLFAKILEHSGDVLNDLDIFSQSDKESLLKGYKPSAFNGAFINKRYDILRHFILSDKTEIKELAWRF